MINRTEFDAEVKRLYLSGQTMDEIAAAWGWSHGTIARSLMRSRTPMRKGGQRKRVPA